MAEKDGNTVRTKQLSFTVSPELYTRMTDIARKQGLSLSQMLWEICKIAFPADTVLQESNTVQSATVLPVSDTVQQQPSENTNTVLNTVQQDVIAIDKFKPIAAKTTYASRTCPVVALTEDQMVGLKPEIDEDGSYIIREGPVEDVS